jgi:hypothetical protein
MLELDSTAGYRIMWRSKDTSNVVFIDKRREVKPNIVADARALPFRDGIFDRAYCDPPHWFRVGVSGHLMRLLAAMPDTLQGINHLRHSEHDVPYQVSLLKKYGYWQNKTQWVSFAFHTNQEFARVLKPNATLWYKLCHMPRHQSHITVDRVREHYSNFRIIEKIEYPSRSHQSKSTTIELTLKRVVAP